MRVKKPTSNSIREAAKIVKEGGIVVYPTDTVYGLGCDPFNVKAVKRIFEVKGRGRKPLPILASSIEDARKVAHFNDQALKLAERFWPGALTIILKRKRSLPSAITCGLNDVGVRIPKDDVALKLIDLSGGVLIGTSANLSGEKPPRKVDEISKQISEKVDLVLDGGLTSIGESSTVVSLTSEKPTIVRPGPIKAKEIAEALGIKESDIRLAPSLSI